MQTEFHHIDTLLCQHQSLWRFEPFQASLRPGFPWKDAWPGLTAWLESLSLAQIEAFKSSPEMLAREAVRAEPELAPLLNVFTPEADTSGPVHLPKGADNGIPGRKLSQILAMGSACLAHDAKTEWLEWCSGKGFLGQVLARASEAQVVSFEWQQALCDKGQTEADAQGLRMHFIQGDALAPEAGAYLRPEQHAVALHACGDLHTNLLRFAASAGTRAVSIAPCCYHLTADERYQPMSSVAKESELKLTRAELRIPLQATVTGGERVKRHRQLEMQYRLGLDGFLRQKCSDYQSVPSIKKSELDKGFEHFCIWAAEKKGFDLYGMDFSRCQEYGEKRFVEMERLSLAQQLFQRPLELWLVLDRALFLQEQGYEVSVRTFCDYFDTPRNLLIQAKKKQAKKKPA